jgi:hypothetical protein
VLVIEGDFWLPEGSTQKNKKRKKKKRAKRGNEKNFPPDPLAPSLLIIFTGRCTRFDEKISRGRELKKKKKKEKKRKRKKKRIKRRNF